MKQAGWNALFTSAPLYASEITVGVDTGRTAKVSASFVGNLVENALFPPNLENRPTGSGTGLQQSHHFSGVYSPSGSLVGYNNDGDSSQFYTVGGLSNSARTFAAVRQIFGQFRVAPDVAAEPYNLYFGNVQEMYIMFDFGYGHVDLSDLRIGNTPIKNFNKIDYKIWHNYTNSRPWFYRNDHATKNYDVEIDTGWLTRSAPSADSASVAFELYFPNGLMKTDSEGTAIGETIIFYLEWRRNGGAWQPLSKVPKTTWNIAPVKRTGNQFWINQKRPDAFTVWCRMEFMSNTGQYDIRLKRKNPPQHRRAQPAEYPRIVSVKDEAKIRAISSITFRPPLDFKVPHTVIEFRIFGGEQVSGVLEHFTAIAKRRIPVWDGYKWTTKFSRNPAWVCYEILTGLANPRPISADRIDLDSFFEWSKYCDQPSAQGDKRFTCDANMDSMSTVAERLLSVMHSARASLTMRKGKYSVIWESWPDDPSQVFTAANSWGFTGQRVWTRPVDGLKVEWIDPNLDYQQTEIVVYADGKDEKNAQHLETISCPYCTRWEQAFRDGRYHMAVGQLRPEIFSIQTDIESLLCERGDMVRVQHDIPRAGGIPSRILEINGQDVKLREPMVVNATGQYQVLIRYDDATSEVFDVWRQVDTHTVNLTAAPAKAKEGDLAIFGEKGKISQDFLVRSITPGPELTATLTLVPYSPAIKTADQGKIPPYKPPISSDDWTPDCLGIVDIEPKLFYHDRYPVVDVWLRWESLAYAAFYEVYESLNDEDYFLVEKVAANEFLLWERKSTLEDNYPDEDVFVKVIPITAFGTRPGFNNCQSFSFPPPKDEEPPGKPLFFAGNIAGTTIHLTWLPPDDEDVAGYVLRHSSLLTGASWFSAVTERELIPYDSFSVDVNVRTGTYFLKTIDTSGNFSEEAAQIRTTIPDLEGMNLIVKAKEEPAFTGQKLQVVKEGDAITLDKVGAGPCGAYPWGTYTFDEANTVDVGSIEECYIMADIEAKGDDCIFMIKWVPNIALLNPIAGHGQSDWDVVMQIRTASKLSIVMADWLPNIAAINPIGAAGKDSDWSGWQTLTAGYYTGQFFQFRALLASYNDTAWPVVTKLGVTVDMPDRIVAEHDLQITAGGTKVIFPGGAFKVAPSVATTLDNAADGDRLVISGVANDGFTAEVFDKANKSKDAQIDYVAKGYGRHITSMLPAVDAGKDDPIELMPGAIKRPTSPITIR